MNAPTRRLRIAAADDDRDMQQFFQEVLPHLGHEVVAMVATGRELAERCRATNPDLVITDVKLSDVDGLEVAREVNREREVPFVLVSSHQDAELLERAVAEVMHRKPKTISSAALAVDALGLMNRFSITALFVCDEHRRPIGFLHMHDCLRAGVA